MSNSEFRSPDEIREPPSPQYIPDSTEPVLPAPVPQAQVSRVEGFRPGYGTVVTPSA